MDLRADSGGFLVGQDLVDLRDEQDRLQLLRAIKADTAAMRDALTKATRPLSVTPPRLESSPHVVRASIRGREAANAVRPAPAPASVSRATAEQSLASVVAAPADAPRLGEKATVVSEHSSPILAPAPAVVRRESAPSVAPALPQSAVTPLTATPKRASNGRFVGGARDDRDGDDNEPGDDKPKGAAGRALDRLGDVAEKLKEGIAGMLSGTDQVDPALTAAREVGDIVAPLAAPVKGLGGLLFSRGGEQAAMEKAEKKISVPWYRKLWAELRVRSKARRGEALGARRGAPGAGNQRANVRAERLEREKLERKISVPWYRKLWTELRDIRRAGGRGAPAGSLKLGGVGGLLMKLPGVGVLGKMLGKLGGGIAPVLRLLGKAALPLAAMYSAFQSFSTSTEEYAARMGVELDGSLAQELGVRFVGVLGDLGNTLTFGLAGKFGEYIAPAVSQVVDGIVDRWDKTATWVETKWSDMTGKFDAVVDDARKWFAGKFGGVVDKVKKAGATVTEKVGDTKEAAGTWVADKADAVASAFGKGSRGRKRALVEEMSRSGITDPREQAMFMAQMDHESGGFRASEESFNYRNADRLMAVSGTAKKHGKAAVEAALAQGPEAVAELMYGGRMGNTEQGDAYKYRGRGAIQLTGKDNYAAASKDLGLDLLKNPELAADPAVAAKVAAWYWKKNKLGDAARAGDVTGVTRKINGGTNGLADRKAKYDAYLAAANTGKFALEGGRVASRSVSPIPVAKPAAPIGIASAASIKSASPSVDRLTVPPAPAVPRRLASNESKAPAPVSLEMPLSQNLSDRGLAQAATGGLGMNLGGR